MERTLHAPITTTMARTIRERKLNVVRLRAIAIGSCSEWRFSQWAKARRSSQRTTTTTTSQTAAVASALTVRSSTTVTSVFTPIGLPRKLTGYARRTGAETGEAGPRLRGLADCLFFLGLAIELEGAVQRLHGSWNL